MTRLDPAPELDADGGTHLRPGGGHGEQDPREIVGIPSRESEPQRKTCEELVQEHVARHHRQTGGGRLVHDLVERLAAFGLRGADAAHPPPQGAQGRYRRRPAARAARAHRGQGSRQRRPTSSPRWADLGRRESRPPDLELGVQTLPGCHSSPASIVVYPFHDVIRPSARSRRRPWCGFRPSGGMKRVTSIAWPIPRSLGVGSGKDCSSTLSTTSARRVARRSDRPARQCVYHRPSGIRCSLQSGAARVRNTGTMWASTALGRLSVRAGAPRRRHVRTRRRGRPARPAPKVRKRTFAAQSWRPTRSQNDDHLVAATSESLDHVDRLRERRVIGVDDLGDEDQTHDAPPR